MQSQLEKSILLPRGAGTQAPGTPGRSPCSFLEKMPVSAVFNPRPGFPVHQLKSSASPAEPQHAVSPQSLALSL